MACREYPIGGISVKFPNTPYPCQLSMMSKIIQGLHKKQNCLLESPTGSGKTLSLLCSALAWQQTEKQRIAKSAVELVRAHAEKMRNSCFCDCASRKLAPTPTPTPTPAPNDADSEKRSVNLTKLSLMDKEPSETRPKATQPKKKSNKKRIEYESDSSDDNENDDDTINEKESNKGDVPIENTDPLALHVKEAAPLLPPPALNECSCVCHGMYTNELFQDELDNNEHQQSQKVPIIFFTTRTHKQITNVIKEFKKIPYAKETRMTILASRQHTCIHPHVSKQSNKDELCKKLVKERTRGIDPNETAPDASDEAKKLKGGCIYYNRFKQKPISYENYGFREPVWDIEDLAKIFERKKLCPYYGARELMDVVDIIFCPYNYIVDPRIRSTMGIKLKDNIVIIDEAHNTEDACRESTTYTITRAQLIVCKNELLPIEKFMRDGATKDAAVYFIGVIEKMVGWIDRCCMKMEQHDFDGFISRIWTGLEIVAEFKMQGIGPDNFGTFKGFMNAWAGEDLETINANIDMTKVLIEHIYLMLEFLYMENHGFMDDFKVAIVKSKSDDYKVDDDMPRGSQAFGKNGDQASQWAYTLNFWCLNPAVGFYYLKQCHSVILCSGTLSPMDTFQSELGVKFEHQLEANHVISNRQVWVGCLGYGPTKVNLLANYKTLETYAFQDEIGRLLIDVCQTIPFGILCFLPSYTSLSKLVNRWEENGMLNKLKVYKRVFTETRVSKNFDQLLKDYYTCIEKCRDTETHNGALLFAVYRGRASEGLDFSDNYARAVIAIGIPYPNIKDVQVDLKRKYNNSLCQKKNLLRGDDWYEIQAYRAVNQALGRCIRHKNDWGAIILVDDRYFRQPEKYCKGLSKWIRNFFNTYDNYSDALVSLKEFSLDMKNFSKELEANQPVKIENAMTSSASREHSPIIQSSDEDDSNENSTTTPGRKRRKPRQPREPRSRSRNNTTLNASKSATATTKQPFISKFAKTNTAHTQLVPPSSLFGVGSPGVGSLSNKAPLSTSTQQHTQASPVTNWSLFAHNKAATAFKKPISAPTNASELARDGWTCVNNDVSVISIGSSTESSSPIEFVDECELDFSLMKQDKKRKLEDKAPETPTIIVSTTKPTSLLEQVCSNDIDELDFGENSPLKF